MPTLFESEYISAGFSFYPLLPFPLLVTILQCSAHAMVVPNTHDAMRLWPQFPR